MAEPLDPEMFDPVCPSSVMPIQIGDKWTAMVVICLEGGPRRFTELRVPLRGITPKVLTQTLRAMERDGLATRTAYDENPPRVEYELTDLGRTLLTLIDAARAWSRDHLPALLEARERHETTPRPALLRAGEPSRSGTAASTHLHR
ncbi:helix-turn-helix domain-containing protein [Actinoallomurus sp. NPDC052274]|uniref:winged helix-turn-helix transcriptional regulator n=1 Tax=Actinoallomurus sp. NPDC052274 TaxID=3155420 RepID=UPI00343775AD